MYQIICMQVNINSTDDISSLSSGNQNWLYKEYEWEMTQTSNNGVDAFYIIIDGYIMNTSSYLGIGNSSHLLS